MHTAESPSRDEIEDLEGQTLVRKFTKTLEGRTTLERATMASQEEQNALNDQQIEDRAQGLLLAEGHDDDSSDANFEAVETARCALVKICANLEVPEKPSKFLKIGVVRKPARIVANQAMQGMATYGFAQLRDYIGDLEKTWKSEQRQSAQRFRNLCGGLDAHKNVFALFPAQHSYASALCGSITLIIKAAVNHDEIADLLSEKVTAITDKAGRAAKILRMVPTRPMRELFSQLYAQVFLFYRDAIEWYKGSRTSRFFGSFNESIKRGYEKAIGGIEDTLRDIYREEFTAQFRFLREKFTEQEQRDELFRQRQKDFDSIALIDAGRAMQVLLRSIHKCDCIEARADSFVKNPTKRDPPISVQSIVVKANFVGRETARSLLPDRSVFAAGNEGYSLVNDGRFWLPGADVGFKLHAWFDSEVFSPTLWISSEDVLQSDHSGSYAAALNMVVVAWEAEMPMISHFCERPRFATLRSDRDVEKVGLVGLVYSLISQLLQFKFEKDEFEVSQDALARLDGSDESWPTALELLSALLGATPHLSICVIDSLNDLAFGAGAQWCDAFLGVLFEHQKSSAGIFRILLTTTGQSRVLQDHVKVSDRVFTQTEAREVIRGGRWYTSLEK